MKTNLKTFEKKILNYSKIARQARIKVLDMIYKAQTSHIGSNFSCIDIMTVLFEKVDLDKDKVILSKGWAAASLYYFLWRKGRITDKDLGSYCMPGSKFIGLAEPIIPEIPAAGGSMGFGLPFGVGFALSKKMKNEDGMIYVIMSDGEMDCGTTWESALIASHHKLSNLLVFVDYNKLQAMGAVNEILNIEPIKDKWEAFGWEVDEINGHDYEEIEEAFNSFGNFDRPKVVIAHTVKGKGVSFMEGNNIYHYKAPSEDEYKRALKELMED
ncbi:transketolase [Thermodesulfovibrio sp. TK110]